MTNPESTIMTNRLFGNNEDGSNNQELSGEEALKLLVGEGAKYASVEEMAKATLHGQNHITKLEQEATTFKDAQAKQTSIDDILAAIKTGNDNQQATDDNQNQSDQNDTGSEQVDIVQTVKDALAAQTAQTNATTNATLVKDALAKALGERAGAVYSKVGNDLGVDLDKLSEQSPEAVIKLVTGQQPAGQHTSSLPGSTVNNQQQDIGGELTQSKINELYKSKKLTRDEKFRLEHSQAQKLGKAFFD